MRAHVLITDEETFPVVRDNGFWGVGVKGIPASFDEMVAENIRRPNKPYFKMLADVLGTRPGDLAFLYERGKGFHGVYKIKSMPFFDPAPIGCVDSTWPIRVEIECVHYFPHPVPEDRLFSSRDGESRFWVWFYRKIQGARGLNTINPEAAEGLLELLVKVNGNAADGLRNFASYPSMNKTEIKLPLDQDGMVCCEDVLRAWLVANIDKPDRLDLREIFGPVEDLEWFANNVPYHVSRKNIDLLCFHSNMKYTGFPLRYRFTVVELKRGTAKADDVSQLLRYSRWVAGRLADGEVETVQPVLIAYRFAKGAKLKAQNTEFNERGIWFYRYCVTDGDIRLEKT